jgi:hypothetical protein
MALLGPSATAVIASTDNNVYLAWRYNQLGNEEIFLKVVQPIGLALAI